MEATKTKIAEVASERAEPQLAAGLDSVSVHSDTFKSAYTCSLAGLLGQYIHSLLVPRKEKEADNK